MPEISDILADAAAAQAAIDGLLEAMRRRRVREQAHQLIQQENPVPLSIENQEAFVNEEQSIQKENNCRCEACKMARFEGSKLRGAVIHEYSYRPRGSWKKKALANDPFPYFLGVELETDAHQIIGNQNGHVREEFSRVMPEVAADMRRPKHLWVPKHDGSVTGPEFASHPATLTYWQKHRKQLGEMFKMLVHSGYRSHDNDTCGMHVNISRSAFANPEHLFRFMTLLHANPKWSLRMSQRSAGSAAQWASLDQFQSVSHRGSACRSGFNQYGQFGHGRYVCLNAVRGEPRFEFRLPRGTLRIDRFFKNLEWTVGMIEYSRVNKVKDCTPRQFMDWALSDENRVKYPDLANYLVEKFSGTHAQRDAEAVEGNVPDDESAVAPVQQEPSGTRRIRHGGPVVTVSRYDGVMRYAEGINAGMLVGTFDTFIGDDGYVRYSRNGNRSL